MAALTLDPEQVASERQVILEEIAMYEADPWDALERRVHARLFGAHPYRTTRCWWLPDTSTTRP